MGLFAPLPHRLCNTNGCVELMHRFLKNMTIMQVIRCCQCTPKWCANLNHCIMHAIIKLIKSNVIPMQICCSSRNHPLWLGNSIKQCYSLAPCTCNLYTNRQSSYMSGSSYSSLCKLPSLHSELSNKCQGMSKLSTTLTSINRFHTYAIA